MKWLDRLLVLGACAALGVVSLSLCAPAFGRYSNSATISTMYGNTDMTPTEQTLSSDICVYDFGVYTHDVDADEFAHTLRISDEAPLSGMLRFAWDDVTRTNKDIAVYIDDAHYESVQNSGYADYTVSAADGDLHVPFSLLFSSPATDRVAMLDVSWYPDGADEPTLFARYLLAIAPEDVVGTFVRDDTMFLSDCLLQVSMEIPADCTGAVLVPAAGAFAAGTRYFGTAHPMGATLLRDSAVFVTPNEGNTQLLMDLSASLADDDPFSLTVGEDTMTCSPLTSVRPLTVALSDPSGLVTASQSLTITLTEIDAFRDSDWLHTGTHPTDLVWQVQRYEDGVLHPIATADMLTVTAAQTATGGTIEVAVADDLPPAGTYMLMVTQCYYGYPVLETPIWFFIDYR
jgi:hypothetical protein